MALPDSRSPVTVNYILRFQILNQIDIALHCFALPNAPGGIDYPGSGVVVNRFLYPLK